jgi:hypothetical protein
MEAEVSGKKNLLPASPFQGEELTEIADAPLHPLSGEPLPLKGGGREGVALSPHPRP